jgi:hypothetical protein
LRYLLRFLMTAPLALVALTAAASMHDQSWFHIVIDDLRWLVSKFPDWVPDFPDLPGSFNMWANYIVDHPYYWKGIIRKVMRHPSSVHPSFEGLSLSGRRGADPGNEAAVDHQCSICQEMFVTRDRLGTHLFRVHGIKNECRRYAYGTYCLSCEVEFWSRERHIYHLRKSSTCWNAVKCNVIPMSAKDADFLDSLSAKEQRENVRSGRSPRFAQKPAVPRVGPLPSWAPVHAQPA